MCYTGRCFVKLALQARSVMLQLHEGGVTLGNVLYNLSCTESVVLQLHERGVTLDMFCVTLDMFCVTLDMFCVTAKKVRAAILFISPTLENTQRNC